MADLKKAQLGSPRPKTAIPGIRSLKDVLEDLADSESLVKVKGFWGNNTRCQMSEDMTVREQRTEVRKLTEVMTDISYFFCPAVF